MILRIKASRPVYRRLGVVFGRQYQEFAGDRFTEAELERLQGDPVLTVTLEDGEVADDAGQSGGDGPSPAGGSASAEPPAAPVAKVVRAPTRAPKPNAATKPGAAKGKGVAKAAGKPVMLAAKDEQSGGDGANSSASSAEGEGTEGGKE
ncbi:hypothetical protein FEA48_23535 [Pseudomonas nitroreducens]|uniref:Uncharacterized protein n=1 Tax=Pseudomonas nitroreducens TaxID=46680 RepID=A0A5R8ZWL0_PSENT|nr:hypothetical protein [Pseudomonas nitroreducens]TLP70808.1 hypothetical protein FEA48_23535 [Pseudomonas nitroreducens]